MILKRLNNVIMIFYVYLNSQKCPDTKEGERVSFITVSSFAVSSFYDFIIPRRIRKSSNFTCFITYLVRVTQENSLAPLA